MRSIDMVREFHAVFCEGQTLNNGERVQPKVLVTRMQLITEELGELAMALAAMDLVEVLDAATDLQYVIDGTRLATGCVASEHLVSAQTCINDGKDIYPPHVPEPYVALMLLRDMHKPLSHLCSVLHRSCNNVGAVAMAQGALDDLQLALDIVFHTCGLLRVRWSAFVEVHTSNMSKAGEDGKPIVNAAGRVVKGPNYRRPDLRRVLGLPPLAVAA